MTRVEYDREWTTGRGVPAGSRLRVGMTTERGTPVRFVVQLEHWHAGTWLEVARFDHDVDGPAYRNVEVSGLHIDLYHPHEGQFTKITKWPPQPANEAMGDAVEYIRAEVRTAGTEVREMAVKDLSEYDRPDLRLSPEMHHAQAEMAADRGEEYDPYEFEARIEERRDQWPDLIEDTEPVEGKEDLYREWQEMDE